MKNIKLHIRSLIGYVLFGIILITAALSCNKNNPYETIIPPSYAEFITSSSTATFGVGNVSETSTYTIPIGLTSASNGSSEVKISVSSPTGAISGSQYSISDSIITIPAGKVTDSSLVVSAKFETYQEDRIDTLVFTITSTDTSKYDANQTFTLVVRKSCTIIIDDLVGSGIISDPGFWENSNTAATITKINSTTLNVAGIFDEPSYSFNIVVNESTGAVSVAKQVVGATLPGTSYHNPAITATGTYEACTNVITLNCTYSVTEGNFSGTYTMTIHK